MDDFVSNGQPVPSQAPYAVVHSEQLPHGLLVAVTLPRPTEEVAPAVLERLHPEERSWAATQPIRRRVTWVGGRLALREALRRLNIKAGPIFATERGAPALPRGLVGSVTHKAGTFAAALVSTEQHWQVGLDLELLAPARPGIARKVLTIGEQEQLANLGAEEFWRQVIIRFSMKEAIYKALDPFVRRYVDFDEVELTLRADDSAAVTFGLSKGEGPFVVEARRVVPFAGQVLTTARVRAG